MNTADSIVIVAATRTPIGNFQGLLSRFNTTQLGAKSIRQTLKQANTDIIPDEVIMGCVLNAGLGQAPARQAALKANLPESTLTNSINKVCGSGMKSIMLAADTLRLGQANSIIAGGMESMTHAPYLLPKVRQGMRLGHEKVLDSMFTDGLEDAYQGVLMGLFAEQCAEKYGFSRAQQDEFALASLDKALAAQKAGKFSAELMPIEVHQGHHQTITMDADETPQVAKPDKISTLKPTFKTDGTVTAANASSISDGASTLLLTTASNAKAQGLTPLATIKGYTAHAQAPEWFTTAPVGAIEKLLKQTGWSVDEVDLFEINEAFAVVTLAAMHDLNLPPEKVNVHGGACALGHPLGASGARIVTTLIHALRQYGKRKGIAAICIGGGEACAIAVEIE